MAWRGVVRGVVGGLRLVTGPAGTAGVHAVRLVSPRRRVLGIELADLSAEESAEPVFARLTEALACIATYDGRTFGRIRRDLRRIVVISAGGEFYHPGLRAYVADRERVLTQPVGELASAIVHEAVHARLYRLGIRYPPSARARIKHLCTRAAVDFARRLPEPGDLPARIAATLEHPWWSDAALHQRRVVQLVDAGVPRWLLRLYSEILGFRTKGGGSRPP